jgi:hypothetical protein
VGGAEIVRTLLCAFAEALAPLAFGLLADWLGGSHGHGTGVMWTFLIMLVPLALAGATCCAAGATTPAPRRPEGGAPRP